MRKGECIIYRVDMTWSVKGSLKKGLVKGVTHLGRWFKGLFKGSKRKGIKRVAIELDGGTSQFVDDLSHVTGKTAKSRNRAIHAIIAEDFPNLKLTY